MNYPISILKKHFQEQLIPNTHFTKQFKEALYEFEKKYIKAEVTIVSLKKFIPPNGKSIPSDYLPLIKTLTGYLDIKFYKSEVLIYETDIIINSITLIGFNKDLILFEILYNHITKSINRISYKILTDNQKLRTKERRQNQRGKIKELTAHPYTIASQYKSNTINAICNIIIELLAKRKQTPYYNQEDIVLKLQMVNSAYESTRPYTF
jgi:hypothetical protein